MVSREPDEYHMDFWDAMFSLESKETIPDWEQFQKEFIADGKHFRTKPERSQVFWPLAACILAVSFFMKFS